MASLPSSPQAACVMRLAKGLCVSTYQTARERALPFRSLAAERLGGRCRQARRAWSGLGPREAGPCFFWGARCAAWHVVKAPQKQLRLASVWASRSVWVCQKEKTQSPYFLQTFERQGGSTSGCERSGERVGYALQNTSPYESRLLKKNERQVDVYSALVVPRLPRRFFRWRRPVQMCVLPLPLPRRVRWGRVSKKQEGLEMRILR
jgi:hypothetical protein